MAEDFRTFAEMRAIILVVCLTAVLCDRNVHVVKTTQNTTDRLTPQPDLVLSPSASNCSASLKIGRQLFQTMEGWGGAFTESAALVLSQLNKPLYDEVMDAYFGPDGLQYTLGRVPMGSCDFSPDSHPWSYDDTAGDTNLTHFSVAHDKSRRFPLLHDALNRRRASNSTLRLLGSPWSAPGWMKDNGNMICSTKAIFKGCSLKKDADVRAAYAQYFTKWIAAYEAEGFTVWGVTVQNEPGENLYTYEGMEFKAEDERDFLKEYLGPVMQKEAPHVRVLFLDHNKDKLPEYATTILNDPDAAKMVWGAAVHWYTGDHFDDLADFHRNFSSFSVLATEATAARDTKMAPMGGTWSRGEHYAHDMIGDFNNWVVGFIDWNLALDRHGGPEHIGPIVGDIFGSDAMVIADTHNQRVYLQSFYYYVGHFSKFVPVGSRRLEWSSTGFPDTLETTAFLTPDKTVVVVAMNTDDQPQRFTLHDTADATDVTLPAHSIVTLRYAAE